MAAAICDVSAGDVSSTKGKEEGGEEEAIQIHMHFMALFASKASMDSNVVDYRMWTLKSDEGESSPSKEVVCAYKTRDKMNKKGEWMYLILPEHDGGSTKPKDAESGRSPPDEQIFTTYFEIFLLLKKEVAAIGKFRQNTLTVVFYNEQGEAAFPAEMMEQSKEKDYIFRDELLNFKDDFLIRKVLAEKINKDFVLLLQRRAMRRSLSMYSKSSLYSDIKDFISNSYFGSHIPSEEDLQQSLRKEIRTGSSEFIEERLTGLIHDSIEKNREGCQVITEADLRACFEGMKMERNKMKFDLIDPVPDFVGRGRELRQLLYLLGGTSSQWEVGPAKKVVVSGFGGVGKSELAREYCRRHSSLYDNIAWIHAENEERIAASFRALATEKLGLQTKTPKGSIKDAITVSKECFDMLKTGRALLIFDHAESLKHVTEYLPMEATQGSLHIILTSRFQEWDDIPLIILDNFHPKEAFELVKRSLGQLSGWREDEGQRLCKNFGYYPLALKQAVSYILELQVRPKKDGITYSIDDYLKMVENKAEALLDHSVHGDIDGDYAETTNNVLITALEQLNKSEDGQMAITILNILSYLSPDHVDVDSICCANPNYSKNEIMDVLSVLRKLSVISLDCGKVRIQRMVQLLNRNNLRKSEQEVSVLREAMVFAASMDVQHLISVWEWASEHIGLVVEFSHVPADICKRLNKKGLYDVTLNAALSAEETLKTVLGQGHPDVLTVTKAAVHAYSVLGENKKAREKVKAFMNSIRSLQEPKSPKYYYDLLKYGNILLESWDARESISVYEEIVSDGPSVVGANSDAVMLARYNLICMAVRNPGVTSTIDFKDLMEWSKGKLNLETPDRHFVDYRRINRDEIVNEINIGQLDFENCPKTLSSGLNCVTLLRACGKLDKALELMSIVSENIGHKYGSTNPLTIHTKFESIQLLFELGMIDVAKDELDLLCAHLGTCFTDNRFRIESENIRALILLEQGKPKEAILQFLNCCLNEDRDSVDEKGLFTVSKTLMYLLSIGKFKVVARIMKGIFPTFSSLCGMKEIPKRFLEFSYRMSLMLSDRDLDKHALVILKNLHYLLKTLVGETHVDTIVVKLAFAIICCSLKEDQSKIKGIRYLTEILETLSITDSEGDQKVVEMTDEVRKLLGNHSAENN